MGHPIAIAIDGHSSCGKSTLAKRLARALGFLYVDTGAMYRAITYYFLQHKVDIKEEHAIQKALSNINIELKTDQNGNLQTWLNGQNVEDKIRGMEISGKVSEVSMIKPVRTFLVQQQRKIGAMQSVVMDGRDIGTVVFPDARIKIFLTANKEVRAERRYLELKDKGIDVDFNEVLENLSHRDKLDSNRALSPLRKAEDAIVIDNSNLTPDQTFQKAYELIKLVELKP
jgi:CMP/dCMP kinase